MKKLLLIGLAVIIIAGGAVGAYVRTLKAPEPEIATVAVDVGDIIQVVGATGTVEAVKTVDVGTQVNGVIMDLYNTDFNSIVKKGQKIAKIDPKTIEATIESDKANLESANANLERQKIALEDSLNKLRRAEDLARRNLVTQQDLETAQVTVKTNRAQIRAQEASIRQMQARLDQDLVNLGYTDIYAPVNGIVINKKVDVGQTVVSNNQATSMFQIAEDLTKMQLKVSVDESDVGVLRPGQLATFSVDAYPGKTFAGTVHQVRLQPVVTQNVVTYTTIINVPNPDLELKPGMTANVRIEIARRTNVKRIPVAALRFRATSEVFGLLNLPVPPDLQQLNRTSSALRAMRESQPIAGDTGPSEGVAERGATTVDALFGELTFEAIPGRVWVCTEDARNRKALTSLEVRTGVTDGTHAEILEGPGIQEGTMLLTSVTSPQRTTTPVGMNPLMPGRRPGGGGDHGPH